MDADLFRRLRARGEARGPEGIEDLRRALELVTGRPYDQPRSRGYGWLVDTPFDHYLTAAIVDVAHIVATFGLTEGQPKLALWAAEKAITAAPSEDKPRLDLARAIQAMGGTRSRGYLPRGLQPLRRRPGPLDPSERTKRNRGATRPERPGVKSGEWRRLARLMRVRAITSLRAPLHPMCAWSADQAPSRGTTRDGLSAHKDAPDRRDHAPS